MKMDKQKVKKQFRRYRQQIIDLNSQVAELNEQLSNQYYCQEEAVGRASRRTQACERECQERERQAESDRWYREDELRRATSALERAHSYGDEYGVQSALRKIKSLG